MFLRILILKKKILVLSLVIVFIVGVFLFKNSYILAGVSSTKIELSSKVIKLGKCKLGETKIVCFNIKNVGESPLIIYAIKATCGCTKSEWLKKPLLPQNETEIQVTYDSKFPGRFVKTITVLCNIKEGKVDLQVMGEVQREK